MPPQSSENSKYKFQGSHFPPGLLETFLNKTHTKWFCKWESYRNVPQWTATKGKWCRFERLTVAKKKKEQFQQAKSEVWCNCAGILNGVDLLGPNSPCQDMRHGQWRPPRCWGKGLRFGHMSSCWTRWNGCTDSWICSCLSVQAQDAASNSYLIDKRLLHFLVVGLGT